MGVHEHAFLEIATPDRLRHGFRLRVNLQLLVHAADVFANCVDAYRHLPRGGVIGVSISQKSEQCDFLVRPSAIG